MHFSHTIIGILGSACIGFVWGWLMGKLKTNLHSPYITILSVLFATSIISAQILLIFDWTRLLYFYGAALFAWFVHVELQRLLLNSKTVSNP